jgi:PadR family transcriptional regulator, regulatory protein PadR
MVTTTEDLAARWLKGLIEACVLGVLAAGPAYGYEIASQFEAAGLARPKGGSLYPILARLEANGLLKPSWTEGNGGPGRKYYHLTQTGVTAAQAAATEWERFVCQVSHLITTHNNGGNPS